MLSRRARTQLFSHRRLVRSRQLLMEALEARHLLTTSLTINFDKDTGQVVEGGEVVTATVTYGKDNGRAAHLSLALQAVPNSIVGFDGMWCGDQIDGWVSGTNLDLPLSASSTSGTFTFQFSPFVDAQDETPESNDDNIHISGSLHYDTDPPNVKIDAGDDVQIRDIERPANDNAICPKCSCQTSACAGEMNLGALKLFITSSPTSLNATNVADAAGTIPFSLVGDGGLFNQSTVSYDIPASQLTSIATSGNVTTQVTVLSGGSPNSGAVSYYAAPESSIPSSGELYRFVGQLPTGLSAGSYDYKFEIKQGSATIKTLYGQAQIADANRYTEFGPGWGVEDMSNLELRDANNDGSVNSTDAAGQTSVWVTLVGGSQVRFDNQGSGNFGSGSGDFANWKLTYSSTAQEYTITTPDASKIVYDAAGALKRQVDDLGNAVAYTYGDGTTAPLNKLFKITQPDGRYLKFLYDANNLVQYVRQYESSSDSTGVQRMEFVRESSGLRRITEVKYADPDGTGTGNDLLAPHETFEYVSSSDSRIAYRRRYPYENDTSIETTAFTYVGGRLYSLDKPNEEPIYFATAIVDAMGSSSPTSPPALVKAAENVGVTTQNVSISDAIITQSRYNEHGQLVEEIDDAGNHWNYAYTNSRLTSTTTPDPDGSGPEGAYTATYTYTSSGLVDYITYTDGTTDDYEYTTISSSGATLVSQHTDREGHITKYYYDSAGNLQRVQEVIGTADTLVDILTTNLEQRYNGHQDDIVTTWEYSTSGVNVVGLPSAMVVWGPNGTGGARAVKTAYTYTAVGLLASVVEDATVSGQSATYANATTTYSYNSLNQLTKIVGPLGQGRRRFAEVLRLVRLRQSGPDQESFLARRRRRHDRSAGLHVDLRSRESRGRHQGPGGPAHELRLSAQRRLRAATP